MFEGISRIRADMLPIPRQTPGIMQREIGSESASPDRRPGMRSVSSCVFCFCARKVAPRRFPCIPSCEDDIKKVDISKDNISILSTLTCRFTEYGHADSDSDDLVIVVGTSVNARTTREADAFAALEASFLRLYRTKH